jgi:hypothetical protein
MGRRWLALALTSSLGCGGQARPSPSLEQVAGPVCGNGIVERGELCDPNVAWADRCPEPWGMCWTCGPSCTTRIPSHSEPVEHLSEQIFCTQASPGSTTTRSYGAYGHVMSQRQTWASGPSASSTVFHRDDHNRIVGVDQQFDGNQMKSQSRIRHELDTAGRRIRTWDETQPDREWRYLYGEDGLLLRMWGGKTTSPPESDRRLSYDLAGRMIADVTTFADSAWHSVSMFRYDELGRRTDDVLGSAKLRGKPSFVCHTAFSAAGSTKCCSFAEPATRSCVTRDRRGEELMHGSQHPGQPALRTRQTNRYDARGLASRRTVIEQDGTVNRIEHLARDAWGNLLRVDVDVEGNGTVDHVSVEQTYECLHATFAAMPNRGFVERRVASELAFEPGARDRIERAGDHDR